jgi:V-type H+-transporting ATPase subunit d
MHSTEKMVNEFHYLRYNAVQPLATFLDYVTYGYMIDNVILLITGTLHERDTAELIERCHPLGMFKTIASLTACRNVSELYHSVLIDTPLGPYIQEAISEEDFHDEEKNVEIIRNTLHRAYLRDFYDYCMHQGGATAEIMGDILAFEADRRAITITINSFGTELSKDDRAKLYPTCGRLYPEGVAKLAKADDIEQVREGVSYLTEYRKLFQDFGGASERSLEDAFFEYEVKLNKLAFETQMGYGVFYAYFKLREQEIRNIVWIAECISQGQKSKLHQGLIPIF